MLVVVLGQQPALPELTYGFSHEEHCPYFHSPSLYRKIPNSYTRLVLLNVSNVAASSPMLSTQMKTVNSMRAGLEPKTSVGDLRR